jgi:hypothetical protein
MTQMLTLYANFACLLAEVIPANSASYAQLSFSLAGRGLVFVCLRMLRSSLLPRGSRLCYYPCNADVSSFIVNAELPLFANVDCFKVNISFARPHRALQNLYHLFNHFRGKLLSYPIPFNVIQALPLSLVPPEDHPVKFLYSCKAVKVRRS